ncbi:DNA mismatch repair endonuclease MutL [Flavobacterium columnare]|uniref:DNA mismatch repair endonuclease MutL n=1 Tax=Flavobacterium columnare TaxID=996 RepID=UPI0017817FCF|nr:DNA mismatch repair endonuclease MutL [Flavobacterium columnare]QOG88755.1 DNA mismatch repair endonuclease MutL [Flavobacterium columnare]QOG91414.1 DNA mismatch repair endonuclease MutL [Flavobacterium columnare]QOG94077.1 DNA mismatch repair endonuclease MutL [Flavobacterium columnare]QOG96736.1 DNA mismatch repair endonuclease MutL [Flavobacterium columnare]QOG99394.1 DNA mismatch repair endonuclease MutL [Flavobacterium columnare]
MSSIIQLLPDHVANQIAAGEVVQRPASVVKELVENAIDAGSTDIKLICKDAGKTLIQVIDNGKGMSVTDARLCFERHATSKIRKAEDLFDLHTKGFRGEALASIAAIAHVELKTKQDQEELGTHLIIEGSKFVSQEPSVLPKGTSFAIKNLFFNIPARRNFLKSDTVELRHIIDDFQRVALAHENIHFTFYHNGSEVFNLPQSNLRQRIVNIFAGKTNEKLVPVTEDTEIVRLKGFIGKPEFAKKNRGEQFFFVNDRFIKSGYLHHAIMAAYEGLLKEGMQPSYFLYLDVPPHTIDINIHPTKTEIKFDDEQALYAIIRSAVKHSLGQFNVAPILDFDRDANLDTPYSYVGKDAEMPTIQVDATFNPFAEEAPAPKKESTGLGSFSSGSSLNYQPKKESQSWESLYVGLKDAFEPEEIHFESESVTGSLFNDTEIEKAKSITYQLQKKYIISPIKSGMLIVDQQRAHQRILYEQLLKNITVQQANSQQLLFPLTLYFSGIKMALFLELKASLENAGFIFESAASGSVVISGIPVTMLESEVARVLEQLIADLQEEIPDSSFSQMDSMAKSMARSLAVKTGTFLTELEQENIVNNLFACKEQSVSPFNRPTFITLSVEDIDKKFSI